MDKNTCNFNKAWIGNCKELVAAPGDRCAEHAGRTCTSCGAPATHNCAETMGLVCGADLCDECEHTIRPNGCNSGTYLPDGMKGHCRKSAQRFVGWYEDNAEARNAVTLREMGIDDLEAWNARKREEWRQYFEKMSAEAQRGDRS